jgi:hypothetical protein
MQNPGLQVRPGFAGLLGLHQGIHTLPCLLCLYRAAS